MALKTASGSDISLGAAAALVQKRIARMRQQLFAERFWAKDPALWSRDLQAQGLINGRLGWLSVLPTMRQDCALLRTFADDVRRAGFTHAVLLGMGGSSLCPDVCRRTFGVKRGYLDLAVLDSTDPAAVRNAERRAPLGKTLFIVATKSGTTTETLAFFRYFFERVRQRKGAKAGDNFVAITDPGSPLVALADEKKFRRTFLNPPDIGGRYSALSYFGLVPAALIGANIEALIERATDLLPGGAAFNGEANPAFLLGAALAELGARGRDKVTLVLSPAIAAFGCWAEQLVAESTGKEGKGLFPVDGEPLGRPKDYGSDRVFVHLRLHSARDANIRRRLAAIERAGHSVIRIDLKDKLDLGREFFNWEIATAVAAALWQINAFDEPNVSESKASTERFLRQLTEAPNVAVDVPAITDSSISVYGNVEAAAPAARKGSVQRLQDLLAAHFRRAKPGGYVAILAYLAPAPGTERLLQKLRVRLRDSLGVATSVGYGPRYLHSTGQLHKGGPDTGVFLQITAKDSFDLSIPSLPYGFSLLKQAQARGDQEALESRRRPFLRLHLRGGVEPGLRQLLRWIEKGLTPPRRRR